MAKGPKFTIELPEDLLKVELDQVIRERIAAITDEYIERVAHEIIQKKLDRLNLEAVAEKATENLFKKEFGEVKRYNSQYAQVLHNTAVDLLQKQLQLSGIKKE